MDLGETGGAVPSVPTQYTSLPFSIDETDVVDGAIPITFAFRNDFPGLLEFWGAELIDMNTHQNLLANGNFGVARLFSTSARSWTYAQPTNGLGVVAAFFSNGCPMGNCWVEATAGGYDELSQTIRLSSVVLNSQDQYEISFFVSDPNAQSSWTWRQYSTVNSSSSPVGGNATDILAYVGKVGPYTNVETSQPPPAPVPEPSTWAMMLLGFAGLGLLGYRRGSARASTSRT